MLLLATDTSGRGGGIALANGNPDGKCQLIETVALGGGAFSAQLVPQIASLLSKNGFRKADIDGFAVVSGPGSFTGLRVGLAAIKALAEVLIKPIAVISMLEAIAFGSGCNGRLVTAIDAGRQQIYLGEYEVSLHGADCMKESLITQAEFADVADGANIVSEDSSLTFLAESNGGKAHLVSSPNLELIAALGWRKILAGITVLPEHLEANYISRPNAEILLKTSS